MNHRSLAVRLAACAALQLVSATVLAQAPVFDAASQPSRFTPAIEISTSVDTNVFNTPERPVHDVVWSIAPRSGLNLPLGVLRISGAATSDFVYFQQSASERSLNVDAWLRTAVEWNRVRPYVTATWLRTRQRPSVEVDSRSLRYEQSVTTGLAVRISDTTVIDASATRGRIAFDQNALFADAYLRDVFNRSQQKVTLALRQHLTPLTTVAVVADGADDRFEYSPERDARSIRVAPELSFDRSALVSGRASIGYRSFVGRHPAMPDFRGVVAAAELACLVRGTTRLSFQAQRDLEYSYETIAPYYVINGVGGGVIQQMTDAIGVTARGMRYRIDFQTVAGTAPRAADTLTSAGLGVLYKLGASARLDITADYYKRQSPQILRGYDGLRIGSSIVFGL